MCTHDVAWSNKELAHIKCSINFQDFGTVAPNGFPSAASQPSATCLCVISPSCWRKTKRFSTTCSQTIHFDWKRCHPNCNPHGHLQIQPRRQLLPCETCRVGCYVGKYSVGEGFDAVFTICHYDITYPIPPLLLFSQQQMKGYDWALGSGTGLKHTYDSDLSIHEKDTTSLSLSYLTRKKTFVKVSLFVTKFLWFWGPDISLPRYHSCQYCYVLQPKIIETRIVPCPVRNLSEVSTSNVQSNWQLSSAPWKQKRSRQKKQGQNLTRQSRLTDLHSHNFHFNFLVICCSFGLDAHQQKPEFKVYSVCHATTSTQVSYTCSSEGSKSITNNLLEYSTQKPWS